MDKIETKRTVYWPDGRIERDTVMLAEEPTLAELKAVMAETFGEVRLEHVTILQEGERRDMFVDERGQPKGLPRNEAATLIYRNNWMTQHPDTDPETLPDVAGPAVTFGRRVWW